MINIGVEVFVYIKLIVNLLKLKLKLDKIMIVVAIDKVKQKSFRSARMVTIKVMDQFILVKMQVI